MSDRCSISDKVNFLSVEGQWHRVSKPLGGPSGYCSIIAYKMPYRNDVEKLHKGGLKVGCFKGCINSELA